MMSKKTFNNLVSGLIITLMMGIYAVTAIIYSRPGKTMSVDEGIIIGGGGALLLILVSWVLRKWYAKHNVSYAKELKIEAKDERNTFLRYKSKSIMYIVSMAEMLIMLLVVLFAGLPLWVFIMIEEFLSINILLYLIIFKYLSKNN